MSDMNVGIVGLGWVAGAHIETFKTVQGGNVTAICSDVNTTKQHWKRNLAHR